ncbi:MAG: hypothetical protein ACFFCO_00735, partial [Promethearchaeota archaeon]
NMGRDKVYGFLILLFAVLFALYYTYWAMIYPFMYYSAPTVGDISTHAWYQFFGWIPLLTPIPYFAVAIPLWIAIVLILFIIAWIGWTMLTTPPPIPLEEIEEDEESG